MPTINVSLDKERYEKLRNTIMPYYQLKASFIRDWNEMKAIRILIDEWNPPKKGK